MKAEDLTPTQIEQQSGSYIRSRINVLNDPNTYPKITTFYKNILQKYITLDPTTLTDFQANQGKWDFHKATLYVSEKIDGQGMVFVYYPRSNLDHQSYFCNFYKRIIFGLDLIEELQKMVEDADAEINCLILVGELYASPLNDPKNFSTRSHGREVINCLATPDLSRLAFKIFDLIAIDTIDYTQKLFPLRWEKLKQLFSRLSYNGRVNLVNNQILPQTQLKDFFEETAVRGNGEGIVIQHSERFLAFKVKPIKTLDAVIIGALESLDDSTRLDVALIALMTPQGLFQVIGRIGSSISFDHMHDLWSRLESELCSQESDYLAVSRDGRRFRMVHPTLVVQVLFLDIFTEDIYSNPIYSPQLTYDPVSETYSVTQMARMVSLIGVRFDPDTPLRLDKQVQPFDVRLEQLQVYTPVVLGDVVIPQNQPRSTLIARYVFENQLNVRKFLLWKTNKESDDFLEYVLTFTDYSSNRQEEDQLQRTVKTTNGQTRAYLLLREWILEEMLNSTGIDWKRGWRLSDFTDPEQIFTPSWMTPSPPTPSSNESLPLHSKKTTKKTSKKSTRIAEV